MRAERFTPACVATTAVVGFLVVFSAVLSADEVSHQLHNDDCKTPGPPVAPKDLIEFALVAWNGEMVPHLSLLIGSTEQNVTPLLDIGSSFFFLPRPGVGVQPRLGPKAYQWNPDNSKTARKIENINGPGDSTKQLRQVFIYGDGNVTGLSYTDMLRIPDTDQGRLTAQVPVVSATIVGLSQLSVGIIGADHGSTTFPALLQQNGLPQRMSLELNRIVNDTYENDKGEIFANIEYSPPVPGGSFKLGNVPVKSDYQGGVLCADILPFGDGSKRTHPPAPATVANWWQYEVDSVKVGDVQQQLVGKTQLISDSGASTHVGPAVYRGLMDQFRSIGRTCPVLQNGTTNIKFGCSCDSVNSLGALQIRYTIGDFELSIGPEVYMGKLPDENTCGLHLEIMPNDDWMIMGSEVFSKFLTFYDYENDQIGYALKSSLGSKHQALPQAATRTCKALN